MPPQRARLLLASAAAVVALLAAYWWVSPYLAVRRMVAAARAGDAQTLSLHVDYPRVRASLKAQLNARIDASIDERPGEQNPMAGWGRAMGRLMVEPVIDALVQPAVVMLALRQGLVVLPSATQAAPGAPAEPSLAPTSNDEAREWSYRRESANRLVALPHPRSGDSQRPMVLVFERSGFAHWQLVELRLPPAMP